MANYDRRILVPYLRDVCSIELLCSRLEKEISRCNNDIQHWTNAASQKIIDPSFPWKSNFPVTDLGSDIGCAVIFGIIALVGLKIGWNIIGIGLMLFGGFFVLIFLLSILSNYQDRHIKFLNAVERYKECVENNQKMRAKIPQYKDALSSSQQELATLKSRLDEARKMRSKVYSVNIIAGNYRNKYAAYYLYDYFRTSRETDLDKIIQTLLLEEIKEKLDNIIALYEEMIFVQRYQVALQEQQNKAISDNHIRELQQIARLERNQQLQIDYQNMIAQNQQLTNFFLAADYIQKYR